MTIKDADDLRPPVGVPRRDDPARPAGGEELPQVARIAAPEPLVEALRELQQRVAAMGISWNDKAGREVDGEPLRLWEYPSGEPMEYHPWIAGQVLARKNAAAIIATFIGELKQVEETPTREWLMKRAAFYAGVCERQDRIIDRLERDKARSNTNGEAQRLASAPRPAPSMERSRQFVNDHLPPVDELLAALREAPPPSAASPAAAQEPPHEACFADGRVDVRWNDAAVDSRRVEGEVAPEPSSAALEALVEEFTGWWWRHRDGSPNAAYARVDAFTKAALAALVTLDARDRGCRNLARWVNRRLYKTQAFEDYYPEARRLSQRLLWQPQSVDAVDPHAGSTGTPSTRAAESSSSSSSSDIQPILSALQALCQQWREAADWEAEEMGNGQRASTLDQCADELDTLIQSLTGGQEENR